MLIKVGLQFEFEFESGNPSQQTLSMGRRRRSVVSSGVAHRSLPLTHQNFFASFILVASSSAISLLNPYSVPNTTST